MSIETDYATLRRVLHEFEPQGWAVEFGVYSGYSLDIIAAKMPVIGFDSFEGLPEDWREDFPKGTFAFPQEMSLPYIPNAMLVPGWFENTVPGFPFPPLGLVHIDCDLYSSTVTALNAITEAVFDGTIIVFDEYHSYPGAEDHEEKAFREWINRFDMEASVITRGEGQHAQEIAFTLSRTLRGSA